MKLKRILLVEDDTEDQYLFTQALDCLKMSIHCKSVDNGYDALNHLEQISNYEVIFLDLNMPKMDGLNCLKAIKQHEKYKDIPVVIFTTSINPFELEECIKTGATTIFHKPNKFPDLCNGLHTILASGN